MKSTFKVGEKVQYTAYIPISQGGGSEEREGLILQSFYNTNTKEVLYKIDGYEHWVAEKEILS